MHRHLGDAAEAERLQRRELGADRAGAPPPAAGRYGRRVSPGGAMQSRARRQCRDRRRSAAAFPAPLLRPRAGGAAPPGRWRRRHGREGCRRRHSAPAPRRRRGCRRAPSRRVSPKSAASAATWSTSPASPPKSCAQPVMSSTSASAPSSATQGLKRPAQRRSAARKAASRGRILGPGHQAGADRAGIAERHAAPEARRLGGGGEAGEQERAACIGDHRQRRVAELRLGAQHPLGGEAGEPEREDAARLHGGTTRLRLFPLCSHSAGGGVESVCCWTPADAGG